MGRPPKKLQRAPKRQKLHRREQDVTVTSMVLPRALHAQATSAAYALNWSMAELVRHAVVEFLAAHAAELPRTRS